MIHSGMNCLPNVGVQYKALKKYCSALYPCWPVSYIVPPLTINVLYISIITYQFQFTEPNDESGANVDAAIMWRDKREQFNKIAKSIVRKTLGLPS